MTKTSGFSCASFTVLGFTFKPIIHWESVLPDRQPDVLIGVHVCAYKRIPAVPSSASGLRWARDLCEMWVGSASSGAQDELPAPLAPMQHWAGMVTAERLLRGSGAGEPAQSLSEGAGKALAGPCFSGVAPVPLLLFSVALGSVLGRPALFTLLLLWVGIQPLPSSSRCVLSVRHGAGCLIAETLDPAWTFSSLLGPRARSSLGLVLGPHRHHNPRMPKSLI